MAGRTIQRILSQNATAIVSSGKENSSLVAFLPFSPKRNDRPARSDLRLTCQGMRFE